MSSHRWTPSDLPDLHGRRAVVTGASSGIGVPTVLELARHGVDVVMAVRDPAKGDRALAEVRRGLSAAPGAGGVELGVLDLADLASVRAFARQWSGPLHLLVNNAGVMALPQRQTTADGFEMQLGTNHLGHFALTGSLLPHLQSDDSGRPARVVTLTSVAHTAGRVNLTDLQSEQRYRGWTAYSQSKLANLLFTMELQRRAVAAGWPLLSVAAHPGFAATNLISAGPASRSKLLGAVAGVVSRPFSQSAEHGAWPTLYAAGAPDVHGAELVGPGGLGGTRGHPVKAVASPTAYDVDLAGLLWQRSLELTGVAFDVKEQS
ncbi:oxidoreductase [Angustibacter aerolatus]